MKRAEFFTVECAGDMLILTPGTNLGEFHCLQLETEKRNLLKMFDAGRLKNAVIDFHAVEYIGSTALALLVSLGEEVQRREGRMLFCNVSSHVLEVLEVTNLSRRWPIVECKRTRSCTCAP
jgi:anti-anti-sigma factor